jgi:hypothetical protein
VKRVSQERERKKGEKKEEEEEEGWSENKTRMRERTRYGFLSLRVADLGRCVLLAIPLAAHLELLD